MHSFYRLMITMASVVGLREMGNIVTKVGIEPTFLVIRASVITDTLPRLPDVITILTPTCLCRALPYTSVPVVRMN